MATLSEGLAWPSGLLYRLRAQAGFSANKDLRGSLRMTHETYDENDARMNDIVAADEVSPSLGRQLANGISGLLILLATGVTIVLLVLWKSP
jgi:hypothetical protein